MSVLVSVLLILSVLVLGPWLWTKVAVDRVGRPIRTRRGTGGLQGRLMEWLYFDAPLQKPRIKQLDELRPEANLRPADRALQAAVRQEAIEHGLGLAEAHQRLQQRFRSPLASAFLSGKMERAIRTHWRTRYRGPPRLFWPWYYLVASIRYGRRRLFLETLTATLKELRTP